MMQGLLGPMDDPQSAGLLSLGLRLMSTPGNFGSALGSAGLGAMGDMQQARQMQQRNKQAEQQALMQKLQMEQILEQARRQKEADALRAAAEQRRGSYLDSINPSAGPSMPMNPAAAMSAGLNASEIEQLSPASAKPIIVGDTVLDPRTFKPLYQAPQKAEKLPEALRALAAVYGEGSPEYQQAARQYASKLTTHQPGVSVSYGAPVPFQLPDGSTGYAQPGNKPGAMPQTMTGPDGKPLIKPAEDKALTEGQAKALAFSSRMLAADKTLGELSRAGVNVSTPGADAGYGVGAVVNAVQGEKQQMLDQAKRDFINATLRRESGAVIGRDEFVNADKQYFPQIGDSRPVIEQKARNRRSAIEGVRADVPKSKQGEVDRISGTSPKSAVDAALEKYGQP